MKQSHFLSSSHWQNFQNSLGRKTFLEDTEDYHFLAILETEKIKKIYCPYSPFIKNKSGLKKADQKLTEIAKENKAILVRIEPTGDVEVEDLKKLGYKKVKSVQPELTWLIDLSQTEEEIVAQMKKNNRGRYRNAHKKGLSFHQTTDLDDLEKIIELIHGISVKNKVKLHKADYLRKQAKILLKADIMRMFVVKLEDKIIGGTLVCDYQGVRYHTQSAADPEFHKTGANTFLKASTIIDAKRQGLKYFDFWGITDSQDPNHPWYGFTQFKKSFGGAEYRYLGTWEKPINKTLYAGLNIAKKVKKIVK